MLAGESRVRDPGASRRRRTSPRRAPRTRRCARSGDEVELLGQSAHLESKRWAPIIEASAQYQRLAKFNDYDKYYLTFTPDSVAVGVSLALPLWTGGRFEDTRRQARARLDRAEAQLRRPRGGRRDVGAPVRGGRGADDVGAEPGPPRARHRGAVARPRSACSSREGRSDLDELDAQAIALADADEQAAAASLDALVERVRLLSLRGELAPAILGGRAPCAGP